MGQGIFGDNTYLTYLDRKPVIPEGPFSARFAFRMPYLASGIYAISAAIAEGDQDNHVQHHYIDDAVFFTMDARTVAKGLIGIPMQSIELSTPAGPPSRE